MRKTVGNYKVEVKDFKTAKITKPGILYLFDPDPNNQTFFGHELSEAVEQAELMLGDMKLHYEVWDRIAHLVEGLQKRVHEIHESSYDWVSLHELKGRILNSMGYAGIKNHCILCEISGPGCYSCGEMLGVEDPVQFEIECLGGAYDEFIMAEDWKEQAAAAKVIRDFIFN